MYSNRSIEPFERDQAAELIHWATIWVFDPRRKTKVSRWYNNSTRSHRILCAIGFAIALFSPHKPLRSEEPRADLDRTSGVTPALTNVASTNLVVSPTSHSRPKTADDSVRWRLLPDGLLWDPYLADPHEPRISLVIKNRIDEGYFADATLGGRVGLLRFGTGQSRNATGWQWDLEGAVMTRMNLEESEDVESMDYRFGTTISMREDRWSAKFGYFHISSHVGDEYLIRNPTFERVNYVTESLIAALSYDASESFRLYGETALAVKASGGAKAWQFQTGVEWVPPVAVAKRGGPFTALNINIREAVGFEPAFTLQSGWQWTGPESGRRFRAGLHYHNGFTPQYSFFRDEEQTIGFGTWLDY